MARWLKRAGWGMLALLLTVLIGLMVWEPLTAMRPGTAPAGSYRAEIIRDEYGVPHIYGKTDADVTYGVAWAHAEDDFFTLQDVLAMTRHRLGALTGEKGAQVDYVGQLMDIRGTVDRHYAGLPADVRAVLDGYAAGLNDYAAKHPGEVRMAGLFPVTGEDVAAGFALRSPFFFGLNDVIEPLVSGKPLRGEGGPRLDGKPVKPLFEGGGDPLPGVSQSEGPPLPVPSGEDGALAGSNAFVVAPKRSGDGTTRLLSNSHQPYWGGVAWYEMVIESESGWHFAGATFPGSPYPFLGHNKTLGWTNTVNRPDLIDIYKLTLDESGERYRLDGKWLPLEKRRVWLRARFGPLVIPVPQTVWRSKHGPVIKGKNGTFAIRYAGIDNLDMMTQYYRISKAQDYTQWQAAMAIQGVSATNFIYGDKDGNIAMVYNARFPQRVAGPDWRSILPGDDSRLIWQNMVGWGQVPKLVNPASGYIFNANNTPYLAAGPGDELDRSTVSPLLGVEDDMTNRARRSVRLMEAAPVLDRETLLAIKYDRGYDREGYVAAYLDAIAALDLKDAPRLAEAQTLLAAWDLNMDGGTGAGGRADALAAMVLKDAMASSYQRKPMPDPREQLAKVVDHLTTHFGRLDPPLGDVIRLRHGTVDLPMDGGPDTLRAATTWKDDAPDGRLPIRHGDSFIQLAEWDKAGNLTSWSAQPFGQATTRPDSPHYTDQMRLFLAHKMKPVRFTRAQLEGHITSRRVVERR